MSKEEGGQDGFADTRIRTRDENRLGVHAYRSLLAAKQWPSNALASPGLTPLARNSSLDEFLKFTADVRLARIVFRLPQCLSEKFCIICIILQKHTAESVPDYLTVILINACFHLFFRQLFKLCTERHIHDREIS